MLRLVVREGRTSRTVRVDGDRVVLGSAPGVGVAIRGPGVERLHCRLQTDGAGGLQVVDLGSREGTILGGRRVTRASVATGDELTLGAAAVTVLEIDVAPPAPAPRDAAREFSLAAASRAAAAAPGFEESLYLALRASPPWVVSAGVHGALVLLLLLLPAPGAARGGPRTLLLGDDVASAAPSLEQEDEAPPDRAPLPAVPDATAPREDGDVLAEAPWAAPDASPWDADRAPDAAAPLPRAAELGAGGGGALRIGPSMPTRAVRFDGNPAFDGDGAHSANREAASILRRSLGGEGAAERRLADRIDARRLLVVSGAYDHVEEVLALMGVRHETLSPAEIELVPLDPRGTLLIDCGNDVLTARAASRVRDFVAAGGYLATTDWGLENVIEPAFPGVLRSRYAHGRGVYTRNETVSIRLPRPAHELVRGLRTMGKDAQWWVEDRAHPVEVLDAERVTVLVESDEFGRRYGGSALAVTFAHGNGRVLHLVGHAWQKEGNLKGAYGMQRMLMNFLMERVRSLAAADEAARSAASVPPAPAGPSSAALPPGTRPGAR